LLFAALALLVFASPASANSITPTVLLFHAVFTFEFMLGLALPMSVLAAVIERPFVSWAGVREHTLWYSLQANCLSMAVGYALFPVCANQKMDLATRYDVLGLLWPLFAAGLSIVLEVCYYQWILMLRNAGYVKFGWIIVGNILSNGVVLLLPYAVLNGTDPRLWARAGDRWLGLLVDFSDVLDDWYVLLFWGGISVSVLAFAASFVAPTVLRWTRHLEREKEDAPRA
jgi:hypothetical protein